jgi:hypothetical protein
MRQAKDVKLGDFGRRHLFLTGLTAEWLGNMTR